MIILDGSVDGLEWFEAKNFKINDLRLQRCCQLSSFDSLTLRPRPCHWPPRHVPCSEGLPPALLASSRRPRPWGGLAGISGLPSIKGWIPSRPSYRRAFFQNFMHWFWTVNSGDENTRIGTWSGVQVTILGWLRASECVRDWWNDAWLCGHHEETYYDVIQWGHPCVTELEASGDGITHCQRHWSSDIMVLASSNGYSQGVVIALNVPSGLPISHDPGFKRKEVSLQEQLQ